MTDNLFESFRDFVKATIAQPISILRVAMLDEAINYWDGEKWVVKINKDRSDQSQIENLLHELAHINSNQFHGRRWGQEYATVYKDFYLKWVELND